MNIKSIQSEIDEIKRHARDPERAHSYEDALYAKFIFHVAEFANDELAEMAKEVLKSKDIDFERWTA